LLQENPGALTSWQCRTAQVIKDNLKSDILISTGGGMNLQNSILDDYFNCAPLDVIGIHVYYYDEFSASRLQPYIEKASSSGKKLVMQEWGACYFDTPNQSCSQSGVLDSSTRDSNIRNWAGSMNSVGLPWMYWQILPNPDPHQDWDYEVGINDVNWEALKGASLDAGKAECAFDFSKWIS
jgi:mannan endo-1,4-beta-mannosidase